MSAPPPVFTNILGRYRRGDVEGALAEAEAALTKDPNNPELLQFLGVLRCRAGDTEAGAAHLHGALALKPEDIPTRVNLATALIELGRLAEAESICAQCGSDAAPLARLRGYLLQTLGFPAEAIACYEKVVAGEPRDFESWNNLGNARRDAGDPDGAVAALTEAARLRPDIPVLHVNLGSALADAGRLDESATALARAGAAATNDAAALLEVAKAFSRLGRLVEARALLERAVRLAPRDPNLLVEIGLVHGGLGDRGGAEAAYRGALAAATGCAPAYVNLGILLDHSNRADEIPALLAAAEHEAVLPEKIAFVRALALRREGRLEEALACAEAAPAGTDPNRKAQLLVSSLDTMRIRIASVRCTV